MTSTETFDVIVVGGGGSGLAAAIEAASIGRSVCLLEKNPALGGTTAWSVGSVTATNTPHQIRAGVRDRPQDHFADMPGFTAQYPDRDNETLRRVLTNNMPETFRWLRSLGLVFFGPMPEPPHRKPRMHNVLPNSRAYIHHLSRRAHRLGVRVQLNAPVRDLVTDDGRVTGVDVTNGGAPRRFISRGGIVIASGDFSGSADLKRRFVSDAYANIEPIVETSTGDGQRMAEKVGARIVNGDIVTGPEIRFGPPTHMTLVRALPPWTWLAHFVAWSIKYMPQPLLRPFVMGFLTTALAPSPNLFHEGAILVNRFGARFTDERDQPAKALPDQPDRVGYIILDKKLADKFSAWPHFISTAPGIAYAYLADYRRSRKDVFHSAPTIEGLAASIGVPADTLAKTLADHNGNVDRDGATAGNMPPRPALDQPPYVALGPMKSFIVFTEGGLAVNENLQVLGADDAPIPGLYAAGSAGQGGLLLEGHGHHLGWGFTSGRIAGRNAAYEVTSEDLE